MKNEVAVLNVSVSNDLELKTENGTVVVSSRSVAERFGKRHDHVLRTIETTVENDSTQNWGQYFIPNQYKDVSGKNNKEYLLTRDGFTLLAMGFTGKEALKWKLKYIEAFNQMELALKDNINPFKDMSPELQAIIMQDKKIQQIESKVNALEDNIYITRSQQKKLRDFAREVVIKALGSKHSQAYKEFSQKAFSEFWKSYQNYFNISSYLDTPKKDFQEALEFINAWKPDRELQLIIIGVNTQMRMEANA